MRILLGSCLCSLCSARPGTKYENWHNHQLDRALLTVLQQKMRS